MVFRSKWSAGIFAAVTILLVTELVGEENEEGVIDSVTQAIVAGEVISSDRQQATEGDESADLADADLADQTIETEPLAPDFYEPDVDEPVSVVSARPADSESRTGPTRRNVSSRSGGGSDPMSRDLQDILNEGS